MVVMSFCDLLAQFVHLLIWVKYLLVFFWIYFRILMVLRLRLGNVSVDRSAQFFGGAQVLITIGFVCVYL